VFLDDHKQPALHHARRSVSWEVEVVEARLQSGEMVAGAGGPEYEQLAATQPRETI